MAADQQTNQQTQDRIASNIKRTLQTITQTMEKSGRADNPDDPGVKMVAVSKTVGFDEVAVAIEHGLVDFGENRAQEIKVKAAKFPDVNWHFIGRIQTNKIKDIVGLACLIHSVSSIRVLDGINKRAALMGLVQPVLLEVNISGETSKDGFLPQELESAIEHAAELKNVEVRGLMTMAPQGNPQVAREVFKNLREIRDKLKVSTVDTDNIILSELSMGMTQDFEEAIEQGATLVRLGHSIFA